MNIFFVLVLFGIGGASAVTTYLLRDLGWMACFVGAAAGTFLGVATCLLAPRARARS